MSDEKCWERAKRLREEKNIPQWRVSANVGVAQATLSRFEKGYFKNFGKIVELAHVLGVTPEFLKYGEKGINIEEIKSRRDSGEGSLKEDFSISQNKGEIPSIEWGLINSFRKEMNRGVLLYIPPL